MRFYIFVILWGLPLLSTFAEETETRLKKIEVSDIFVDQLGTSFSGKQISKERLKATSTTDIQRVLKESPGVYSREEDGQGLRPNIGLRGTNPDRSKKIVLLEDDLLIGPAPYSAPAAYYSPSMLTTESLEIYKGFSSLIYGPNSVGGAINYKSKQFQAQDYNLIKIHTGSYDQILLNGELQKKWNSTQFLFTLGRLQNKGFRKIDNGVDNSLEQNILNLKIQHPFQTENYSQILEIKAGYSTETSDETYLGLTENDFIKTPFRRYNSSEKDQMKWSHSKFQLEHLLDNDQGFIVKNQIYTHHFQRTWYRLDGFRDSSLQILNIMKSPTGTNEPFYQVLTGEQNSTDIGSSADLNIANNDRTYLSQGFQNIIEHDKIFGNGLRLKSKSKILLHSDSITRNHDSDYYSMIDQKLVRTNDLRLQTARNKESATATSFALQENIEFESFKVTPQFRYENVHFKFEDTLNSKNTSRSDQIWIPGLGFSYQGQGTFGIKGSVNKAATLSGLDAVGTEKREESTNYEFGLQWESLERYQQFEFTYFINDYENLTGTCTSSNGCSTTQLDQQFNGGKAQIRGIEARFSQGILIDRLWIPLQLNVTSLSASFENDFSSTSPEWGRAPDGSAGQVKSGDPLPYIPNILLNLVAGLEVGKFKNSITISYNGKSYDQSVSQNRKEIDPYGVIDYNLNYDLNEKIQLHFKIDNVLDKHYLVALKPLGYRAGKPRTIALGARWLF